MNALPNRPNITRSLPVRVPRVCVAIVGADPVEMVEKADGLARENSFFEFRLDYLKDPMAGIAKLRHFIELHGEAVCVATCRRVVAGGKFKGSIASELAVLHKAASAGFQFVDLELESAEGMKAADYQKLHDAAGIVLSFHDFKATRKLEETFQRMTKFPADFYKMVSTAARLYDNVVMLKFLEEKSHTHSMVGMCMGEQGLISRVLGPRCSSVFTFAAGTPGEETAPGQIAFRTMRDTYRIEQVDAATRIFGVAGDPVAQSLSPVMMNTAFRRENVNAVYVPLHAKEISDLMDCVRDLPITGLSVTMPYKEDILKYLEGTDPLSEQVGACNTVVRAQTGKLFGFNTDVAGVVTPLELRLNLRGAKVLVIGAGGGARAAVFGLKGRGAEVFIMNRTPAPAQKLAKQAKAKYLNRADLKKYTFDAIVNATPAGMNGDRSAPLTDKELHAKYLLDMVYSDPETPLVKLARSQGLHIIPGTEMFVAQGMRQFEIWTGKPAPVADMAFAVTTALQRRGVLVPSSGNGKPQIVPAKAGAEPETTKPVRPAAGASSARPATPASRTNGKPVKKAVPATVVTAAKPAPKTVSKAAKPAPTPAKKSSAKPAKKLARR
jgi:3-dehydroquinate dehydratase / shikimate dehydrogenase